MKIIHDRRGSLARCKHIQKTRGYTYIFWRGDKVWFKKPAQVRLHLGYPNERCTRPYLYDYRNGYNYQRVRDTQLAQEWEAFIKLYQKEKKLLAKSRFTFDFERGIFKRVVNED